MSENYCPVCNVEEKHVHMPYATEDDLAEFKEILGERDEFTGAKIIYEHDPVEAAKLDEKVDFLGFLLGGIDPIGSDVTELPDEAGKENG